MCLSILSQTDTAWLALAMPPFFSSRMPVIGKNFKRIHHKSRCPAISDLNASWVINIMEYYLTNKNGSVVDKITRIASPPYTGEKNHKISSFNWICNKIPRALCLTLAGPTGSEQQEPCVGALCSAPSVTKPCFPKSQVYRVVSLFQSWDCPTGGSVYGSKKLLD